MVDHKNDTQPAVEKATASETSPPVKTAAGNVEKPEKVWIGDVDKRGGAVETENLTSALGMGVGQSSSRYLQETQASSIAGQTRKR